MTLCHPLHNKKKFVLVSGSLIIIKNMINYLDDKHKFIHSIYMFVQRVL